MKRFALALSILLATSAQAYDYRDSRGIRHWNHYRYRYVPHHRYVRIVQDRVKFTELPDEPPPPPPTLPPSRPPPSEASAPPAWAGALQPCCRSDAVRGGDDAD